MALSAKQQAGWMFSAANAILAFASSGATYLAIEPKAGAIVGIIGAAFVLIVSGAGRASGAYYAERSWIMGTIFFVILSGTCFVDYRTNDMGLKEVATKSENVRKAFNASIQSAKDAIALAVTEIARLEGFMAKAQSGDPADVMDAQRKLKDLGFYDGRIDGERGSRTDAAMTRWSEINGVATALADHRETIRKETPNAALEPNNEASFFTVEMAGLLAYVISAGSLACSFIGGFLCSNGNKKSELELIQAEREALAAEREAEAQRKTEEAEALAELQAAIQGRRKLLAKRLSA